MTTFTSNSQTTPQARATARVVVLETEARAMAAGAPDGGINELFRIRNSIYGESLGTYSGAEAFVF